jgi:Tfp pilus assembly major pilin PilA
MWTQGQSTETAGGHNVYDFLIVTVVIGALAAITIFLVSHYTKASDTASVLGIIVPVFAAVFGGTLGYAAGNTKGKAAGKDQGKKEVKTALMPQLNEIETSTGDLMQTLRTKAVNPAGSDIWRLQADFTRQPISLEPDKMNLPAKIASVQSYLDAL